MVVVTNVKAMENVEPKNFVRTLNVNRPVHNVVQELSVFEPPIIVPSVNVRRYKIEEFTISKNYFKFGHLRDILAVHFLSVVQNVTVMLTAHRIDLHASMEFVKTLAMEHVELELIVIYEV